MTLQVSFDQFLETVQRLLQHKDAYVSGHVSGSLVTAAAVDKALVVAALAPTLPDETMTVLRDRGAAVYVGTWLTPEEVLAPDLGPSQIFVAAVAYRSASDKPGLWVDAFPSLPTQVMALKAMYDELKATGEMEDVPFDEFVQLANPNVVIVTPPEIDSFLKQKEEC